MKKSKLSKAKDPPHGRIPRAFWKDPRMRELAREQRELLLYLYASDQAYTEGIFYLSVKQAAEDLAFMEEEVHEGIAALKGHGLLVYDAFWRVVCLTEAMGIQLPKSDNEAKGWANRVVKWRESSAFPVWRERLEYYIERVVEQAAKAVAQSVRTYIEERLEQLLWQQCPMEERTGVGRASNSSILDPRSLPSLYFREIQGWEFERTENIGSSGEKDRQAARRRGVVEGTPREPGLSAAQRHHAIREVPELVPCESPHALPEALCELAEWCRDSHELEQCERGL